MLDILMSSAKQSDEEDRYLSRLLRLCHAVPRCYSGESLAMQILVGNYRTYTCTPELTSSSIQAAITSLCYVSAGCYATMALSHGRMLPARGCLQYWGSYYLIRTLHFSKVSTYCATSHVSSAVLTTMHTSMHNAKPRPACMLVILSQPPSLPDTCHQPLLCLHTAFQAAVGHGIGFTASIAVANRATQCSHLHS